MRGLWNKLFGNRGERTAARHLRSLGMRILARNNASRLGEIDIVAADGDTIVFVEVKTRRSRAAGDPFEAVNHAKQRKLTRSALAYLKAKGMLEHRARFDVVGIVWGDGDEPEIVHVPNAFEAVGDGQFFS